MKKFINHVDHVAWISRPKPRRQCRPARELTGATLTRFARKDMGFTMCISWEAGLEVVAPMEERTDFNQWLWSELERKGEGVTSVVFGVKDLDAHKARLEAMGFPVGPLMGRSSGFAVARQVGAVGARRRRCDEHQHRPRRHRLCGRRRSLRRCEPNCLKRVDGGAGHQASGRTIDGAIWRSTSPMFLPPWK
jgi:hypothetical protein